MDLSHDSQNTNFETYLIIQNPTQSGPMKLEIFGQLVLEALFDIIHHYHVNDGPNELWGW